MARPSGGDIFRRLRHEIQANAQPRPAEPLPLPAAFYYLPPGATQAKQLLTDVGFPNGVILSRTCSQ